MKYRVDKRGRIRHQLKNGWVLDAGARNQSGSFDREALVAALQIAIGKYGNKLEVQGDQKFVEQVIRAAHGQRLKVSINGQQVTVQRQQQREKGVER
jgi:hypothetical protein